MKNLHIIIAVILLLFWGNINTFAEDLTHETTHEIVQEENEFFVDSKIQRELKASIQNVYGNENVEEVYNNLIKHAKTAIKNRPQKLKRQDVERTSDWFKDEIIYMFYVDQFGVIQKDKNNTFEDTALMLDYLQELGVTTLYLLPFVDSPMEDSGFDVKNPQDVRRELGGMAQFENFIKSAKEKGFKIKSDLVLNHLSDKHEWFKNLQRGDLEYLDYFIWTDKKPVYKKYVDEKLGTVVEYQEDNGTISKRRLIFPENTEDNWREVGVNITNEEGKIETKTYYLYHTFYPFQLDINWEKPEVLYYMLDTISTWANLGVDIFRMDAIPYLSKEKGTNAENQPKTHNIVNILSDYIQITAPSSVIQVEACQEPKDIAPYFGKNHTVNIKIDNNEKELHRTSEAQIAYNFPYMNAIWATLVSEDKKYFTDVYKQMPSVPKNTMWGVFLRVHDELTLEMVSPEVRELIFQDLEHKGAEFRKGFGVSGRLANFLDKNPNRIEMAFSILFSIPGIPIIYYGDEIGIENDYQNAEKQAKIRAKNKSAFSKLLSVFDSRDINRGSVPRKLFYGSQYGWYAFNSKVYNKVKHLISLRKSLPVMSDGSFEILKTTSKENFSYIRKNKGQEILVINNLSKEKIVAEVTLPATTILKNKRKITKLKNLINGDNIRVNISLQNNTMHLRVAPYQVLWLDLSSEDSDMDDVSKVKEVSNGKKEVIISKLHKYIQGAGNSFNYSRTHNPIWRKFNSHPQN